MLLIIPKLKSWPYEIECSFFQEVASVNNATKGLIKSPFLTIKKKVLLLKAPWAMTTMPNSFIHSKRKKYSKTRI